MSESDPERDRVEIRRHELGVLLAVAYAMLDRAMRRHPLPPRTWEVALAIEEAERALLAAKR